MPTQAAPALRPAREGIALHEAAGPPGEQNRTGDRETAEDAKEVALEEAKRLEEEWLGVPGSRDSPACRSGALIHGPDRS